MKKCLLVIMLLLLCSPVSWANKGKVIELNSGITYNNLIYSLEENNKEIKKYGVLEDFNQGLGYYLEGIYWITDKVGVGIGTDVVTTIWSNTESGLGGPIKRKYERKLIGPYGKIKYKVSRKINLSLSSVYYKYSEDRFETNYIDNIYQKGEGIGFLVGTEIDSQINKDLSVKYLIHYRYANIKLEQEYDLVKEKLVSIQEDKELNISGLRVSLGISYKF